MTALDRFQAIGPLRQRPESVRYLQVLETGQPPDLSAKTKEQAGKLWQRNRRR